FYRNAGRADASVVEENVQSPERFLGHFEQCVDLGGFADVGGNWKHFPARRVGRARGPFEFGRAPPGEHHGISRGLKRETDRASYTAARARHERDFTVAHRGYLVL